MIYAQQLISCAVNSGGTDDHPGLLQYTVKLKANIRPVKAAKVSAHVPAWDAAKSSGAEAVQSLLTGRPVIAFAFDNMRVCIHPIGFFQNDVVFKMQHVSIGPASPHARSSAWIMNNVIQTHCEHMEAC